jgi:hypothetical protein
MWAADWRLISALDNTISHQLPIPFEAFDGSGEMGDEVIAEAHRMFQGVGIHRFEIDPVMRALPKQPGFESDPHGSTLRGTNGGSHGVASWLGSYCILEPHHVGTLVHYARR